MAIQYSLYELPPSEDGEKGKVHARAIASSTIRTDEICDLITERSALSAADVKGVLDSFAWVIRTRLAYGYNVELEELGFFSPSLKTTRSEEGKIQVTVDGVNFRCSKKLRKSFTGVTLAKKKREAAPGAAARRNTLVRYLQHNSHISKRTYAAITGCSRYRADLDIRLYEEEGLLRRAGYLNQGIYVLTGGTEWGQTP